MFETGMGVEAKIAVCKIQVAQKRENQTIIIAIIIAIIIIT